PPLPAAISGVGLPQGPSAPRTHPVRPEPALPTRRVSASPAEPKGSWRVRILWATLGFVLVAVAALAGIFLWHKLAQTPSASMQQVPQPPSTLSTAPPTVTPPATLAALASSAQPLPTPTLPAAKPRIKSASVGLKKPASPHEASQSLGSR